MPRAYTQQDHRKAIIFLAALLVITLIFAFVIGKPFLKPIAYAVILATVFHPLYRGLHRKTHRPNLSALISTTIIFLLIVVPLVVLINVAAIQAFSLAHTIAEQSASQGGFVPFVAHLLQKPFELAARFIDLSNVNLQQEIADRLKTFSLKLLPTAASWVGNILGVIVNAVLALITCYFFLRDGDRIVSGTIEFLPVSEAHSERLLKTLKDTVLANVQGVFAVGIVQGIATGISLGVLGVSPATLLGIAAAFCSIVPVVGTSIVWGSAAIYLIVTGKVVKGVILLALGFGVIGMLDNIIRPLVVGTRVQAHGFVIMLAMLGGVQAFGFLGLFIGPLVAALLVAVVTMLSEEATESKQGAKEDALTR